MNLQHPAVDGTQHVTASGRLMLTSAQLFIVTPLDRHRAVCATAAWVAGEPPAGHRSRAGSPSNWLFSLFFLIFIFILLIFAVGAEPRILRMCLVILDKCALEKIFEGKETQYDEPSPSQVRPGAGSSSRWAWAHPRCRAEQGKLLPASPHFQVCCSPTPWRKTSRPPPEPHCSSPERETSNPPVPAPQRQAPVLV